MDFSFINCCDVLGIDPDYLRSGTGALEANEIK